MNYRFKHDLNVINFPEGFEEESRLGCKEVCCVPLLKLASETSTDLAENDVTGIAIKLATVADVVTFKVTKCGVVGILANLGEIGIYPNDNLVTGFIFDWSQYLAANGAGEYKIEIEFTYAGISGGYVYGDYILKPYSIYNAKGTARVYSEPNSFSQKELIDYTDSNHSDSIRFNGFFGNRQPKTEINNLITKARKVEKTTRENLNQYTLETDPIDVRITRRLIDFHFLNEDTLLISDHNASNHDYLIFDIPVVLEDTAEVDYIKRSRLATLKATFGDRSKLSKSYYNRK